MAGKKTKERLEVKIVPANGFEIKRHHKYFLIFDREDAGSDAAMIQLNEALKNFFGDAKVLAIFAKDINSVKIAEIMEESEENGK